MKHHFAFFGALHEPVLKNFFGPQHIAAVNQMNLGAEIAQIEGFFYRGVAAAHHCDLLIAIEKPVTGGAGTDPFAHKGGFGGEAEVLSRSARGDDECIAGVFCGAFQSKGFARQVHLLYVIEDHAGLQPLNMFLHLLHQLRPL